MNYTLQKVSSMDIMTIILIHWMILLLETLLNQERRDRTNQVGLKVFFYYLILSYPRRKMK